MEACESYKLTFEHEIIGILKQFKSLLFAEINLKRMLNIYDEVDNIFTTCFREWAHAEKNQKLMK